MSRRPDVAGVRPEGDVVIDEVLYSFDGDRAAFYEWLQLSAPG
jgi:hypothetical protein